MVDRVPAPSGKLITRRRALIGLGGAAVVVGATLVVPRFLRKTPAKPEIPPALPGLPQNRRQALLAAVKKLETTPIEIDPNNFRIELGGHVFTDWQELQSQVNRAATENGYWISSKPSSPGKYSVQAIPLSPSRRLQHASSQFLTDWGFSRRSGPTLMPLVIESAHPGIDLPEDNMGRCFIGNRGSGVAFSKRPNIERMVRALSQPFSDPDQLPPPNTPGLSLRDLASWAAAVLQGAFQPDALVECSQRYTAYHEGNHHDLVNFLPPSVLVFGLHLGGSKRFPGQRNAVAQANELLCDLVATQKILDEFDNNAVAAHLLLRLQVGLRADYLHGAPQGLPFRDLQTGLTGALGAVTVHIPEVGVLDVNADRIRPLLPRMGKVLAALFTEADQKITAVAETFVRAQGKLRAGETFAAWLERRAQEETAATEKDGFILGKNQADYAVWSTLFRDLTATADGQRLLLPLSQEYGGEKVDALNRQLLQILGFPTDGAGFQKKLVGTFQGR